MIKEILKSLMGTVNERLTSPLFGSFVTAWLILNWRIVYTLLRPLDTAEATISKISTYSGVWLTFWIPLSIALFYVIGYPWIRLVLWKWQSEPVKKQRLAEYVWEKPILEARREVLTLEQELALIRVVKEAEIANNKLQLQANLESNQMMNQQALEIQKLQNDHDVRIRAIELKDREREMKNRHADLNPPIQ